MQEERSIAHCHLPKLGCIKNKQCICKDLIVKYIRILI